MKTLDSIIDELNKLERFLIDAHPLDGIFDPEDWNKFYYTDELLEKFEQVMLMHDETMLMYLTLISSEDGLSNKYTDVLCRLLKASWHNSQEDITEMLGDIKDPASIDALYERALDIPENDDMRALARKCIWALLAINTPEAIKKIELLAALDDKYISNFAAVRLGWKEDK
ncbi:hypothetical protein KTO58_18915 [Chitinophaga pendula]|uniref:hypothetical protein n=1 Tax=Chitinophaga TaxID=79328 RepID=UPI000BAF9936|nr:MULTISPECIES: hypothetical protein [Chitinophaga]ASZ11255.1 hypothetical protein CK934_09895 [Chitinophaga sp. MD30]UCJ05746.1 hypothetical protein KTO58_18915 [Chitinophaga pendula]